jgi:hypothetical protein
MNQNPVFALGELLLFRQGFDGAAQEQLDVESRIANKAWKDDELVIKSQVHVKCPQLFWSPRTVDKVNAPWYMASGRLVCGKKTFINHYIMARTDEIIQGKKRREKLSRLAKERFTKKGNGGNGTPTITIAIGAQAS